MNAADCRTARAVIDLLAERFPKTFFVYQQRRKPLKVGIDRDLAATLDGTLTERELHLGLGWYCRNKIYRAKLLKGAWRIDLNGNVAATIVEDLAPKRVSSTIREIRDSDKGRPRRKGPDAAESVMMQSR
jgi:sRNA-binding protein